MKMSRSAAYWAARPSRVMTIHLYCRVWSDIGLPSLSGYSICCCGWDAGHAGHDRLSLRDDRERITTWIIAQRSGRGRGGSSEIRWLWSGLANRGTPRRSRSRFLLLLVPLLPGLTVGGVEAEQDLELGVGLRRLARAR